MNWGSYCYIDLCHMYCFLDEILPVCSQDCHPCPLIVCILIVWFAYPFIFSFSELFFTMLLHLSYDRVLFCETIWIFLIVEVNHSYIYIIDMFRLSWIIILHLCCIYLYIYCVSFFLCFILFAHFFRGLLFINKMCISLLVVTFMLIMCIALLILFTFIYIPLYTFKWYPQLPLIMLQSMSFSSLSFSANFFCWIISTRSEHITSIILSFFFTPTYG